MSQVFTDKIKSARFINPPENSVIELLYGEANELTAFHLEVNYSNKEFLDFIEEWPLEKIEKAAREAAVKRAKLKEDYDRKIIENYLQNANTADVGCKEVFNYINENNRDKTAVFDLKLSVLEHNMDLKDKKLKLRIRKAKTILDLLQIYNETVK
jgi:hypothetical protein